MIVSPRKFRMQHKKINVPSSLESSENEIVTQGQIQNEKKKLYKHNLLQEFSITVIAFWWQLSSTKGSCTLR